MKLGSLFDGSGGFPLAGIQLGIEPVWASEIEPFPIRVTTKRIPQMKHYGNIMDMNGAKIEPVDVITFGSPCVDLSVAGKREGLQAERSGLFFEAIRVIKEMKEATNGVYPKYIVWENVCGAFSSNKGEDFRAVLESICQIADETVSIPKPDKWTSAGSIVGDGYSVAWRVLDAQYWGVPQRRRRIFLVASFGGSSAADIVFREVLPESQSLRGRTGTSGTQGQTVAGDFKDGTGAADYTLRVRCGKPGGGKGALIQENKAGTLATNNDQTLFQSCYSIDPSAARDIGKYILKDVSNPLFNGSCPGHHSAVCYCVDQGGGKSGANVSEDISPTLTTTHQGEPAVCYGINGEKAGTLDASYYKGCGERQGIERDVVCYALDRASYKQGKNAQYDFSVLENQSPTMIAKGPNAVCIGNGQMCNITMKPIANSLDCMHDQQAVAYSIENHPNDSRVKLDETGKVQALTQRMGTGGGNVPLIMEEPQYIVRRLTPTECARLQGFPDWWCSGLESDPTDDDIDWWYEVFETHRKAMGKSTKPKSRKQIEKYLKNPHSDSAEYKMWGNGVALPCVYYVLKGIVCQDR